MAGRSTAAFLAAAGLLLGCGGPERTSTMAEPSRAAGPTALAVTVDDGGGGPPRTRTLACDPPGGDHPDPEAACRALAAARAPFAPVPPDMMCTQVYGGPETATIEGTWRGEPVRATYRRTDGCEIARWDRLAPVFR